MSAPFTPGAASANLRVNANGERIRAASLAINPRISQWLRFHADGTVEARPGKVEIGRASSRRWRKSWLKNSMYRSNRCACCPPPPTPAPTRR